VGKLGDEELSTRYRELLEVAYNERVEDSNVCDMWNEFKRSILVAAEAVCGTRKIGRGKKGTAWWSEELRNASNEKSSAWLRWQNARTRQAKNREWDNYK